MNFKKIAFIFPGQGSQYTGMAKDFFENFAICRETFEEADSILGRNLSKIVFNGPDELLVQTRNSQTGIYVASIAMMKVLMQQFPEFLPKVCAGLSLGEYTAVTAAKKIDFAECLPLVQFRGEFMNDACLKNKGTMAVVMGLEASEVEQMVADLKIPSDLWVANFNCPGQVVISGTLEGVEKGASAAKAKGAKRVLPLQVHGAFHSGLMKEAEERLKEKVMRSAMRTSSIELVMNAAGGFISEIDQIRDLLIKQVTNPVRWEQGIKSMDQTGVDLFVEIGCGKTLIGMNKRIGVAGLSLSIEKVKDLEEIAKLY